MDPDPDGVFSFSTRDVTRYRAIEMEREFIVEVTENMIFQCIILSYYLYNGDCVCCVELQKATNVIIMGIDTELMRITL